MFFQKPQQPAPEDLDLVRIKSPGGGSISHAGIEYKPDAEGVIVIPRSLKTYIESFAVNSQPSRPEHNKSYRVTLEIVE